MIKDSGSNYSFYDGTPKANVKKSGFDESYINSFTADEGFLIPSYVEETLLNETWRLKTQSIIRVVNSPVVPLASRQRAFQHTYWCSFAQLWKYANVFFPKGRTRDDYTALKSMVVPKITLKGADVKRGSLADMLGFSFAEQPSDDADVVLPALKFMMYLRIIRDYYMNQRIFKEWLDYEKTQSGSAYLGLVSDFMFPQDDADFRIGSAQWDALIQDADAVHYCFGRLWSREWTQDYFTTCQLTPQMSEVGSDDMFSANMEYIPLNQLGVHTSYRADIGIGENNLNQHGIGFANYYSSGEFDGYRAARPTPLTFAGFTTPSVDQVNEALNNSLKIHVDSSMTIDSLRNLACASAILEKLAKCNGDYASFGRAYFGVTPNSAQDFKPKYIGGNYQPIVFTDVVNTGSNQGDVTGKGMSGSSGDIGQFFSDDHGFTMTLFSIIPDTYYSQGWRKTDLYETSDDFYLPERAGLGMQAVLDGELYYVNGDDNGNKRVFGYQNRYDELRYRYNEVHGKVADPNALSFSPFIEQRHFTSKPTLTPSFLSMEGTIQAKWKSAQNEVGYFVQILNDAYAVRPLPYKAKENTLGF